MRTTFSEAQRADPDIAVSEKSLRSCVHCGFCLPTCPTYALTGNELDSPRGRIYLMREMLEKGEKPNPTTVKHLDRCLSCLSCQTTCPSGVDYMHLIDHSRKYVEENYQRPLVDRALRSILSMILPSPSRLQSTLRLAKIAKFVNKHTLAKLRAKPIAPITAMLDLLPEQIPSEDDTVTPGIYQPQGKMRHRVVLVTGCVQQVIRPQINKATLNVLTRHGCEVIVPAAQTCCGALTHHLGKDAQTQKMVKQNIETWSRLRSEVKLDAIILNSAGCGTMVKDYRHLMRNSTTHANQSEELDSLIMDFVEFAARLDLQSKQTFNKKITYQAPCSLSHGQGLVDEPVALLESLGVEVTPLPEAHLCCGSAGTYNIFQPDLASALRSRKCAAIASTQSDLVITANIGCLTQLQNGLSTPILHIAEFADWLTGDESIQI